MNESEKNGGGKSSGQIFGYIIYLPEGIKKDIPLLIYLHGARERGTKLEHIVKERR